VPDLLQIIFQKLNSQFALGGVKPIGVSLATLLASTFDHTYYCAIRRMGAGFVQGIPKLRSGQWLNLFAINEDPQINSPATPFLPLL
jgi:ABC-type uncharacterized transport system substrate-binding protein